jgi:pyrimidine operon attenuation protein/uracil phosphoribosyltransferase
MKELTVLMNAEEIDRALARMAHQILEVAGERHDLALVGVHSRGAPLAQRLAQKIAETGAPAPQVGSLDINLYRDDLSRVSDHPIVRRSEIAFGVQDRRIVLVDDVLFTGRTTRAALDALMDLGRPSVIRLAVLVDRGGKELPIHADFVGRTFMTQPDQVVDVLVREVDGVEDQVLLRTRFEPSRDVTGTPSAVASSPARELEGGAAPGEEEDEIDAARDQAKRASRVKKKESAAALAAKKATPRKRITKAAPKKAKKAKKATKASSKVRRKTDAARKGEKKTRATKARKKTTRTRKTTRKTR